MLLVAQFVLPLLTPGNEIINKIQVDMYKFMWIGKPDKIKREVANNTKAHGGIDMIDFKEFFTALKVKLLGVLGPAHTTPRGVGLMAWAIRRSVFSSHA